MLKWCSYCQQFMGEIPDYDDFAISHGICIVCEKLHYPWPTKAVVGHATFLRGIFRKLFEAGRRNNFAMAEQAVASAIAAGCRPVDILIGMIAPMLHRIGESWKRGTISVEEEHQFSAVCEQVVDLVSTMVRDASPSLASDQSRVLFINAPGNRHTLAAKILGLWLESRLIGIRYMDGDQDLEILMEQLDSSRPKYLLISVSLVEQCEAVEEIVRRIATWPPHLQPKVIVGGYAVKAGLLQPIAGTFLTSDVHALELT